MTSSRCSALALRKLIRLSHTVGRQGLYERPRLSNERSCARFFTSASWRSAVRPYLLADIGEGITECQIVSWSVKEGDIVEQFGPICEVQSDKATVDITSRFDGVVNKLYYEEGDVAKVGSPLMDIDVTGEEDSTEQQALNSSIDASHEAPEEATPRSSPEANSADTASKDSERIWTSTLATPAVRRLLTQHGVDIAMVKGSGKDGRVLKHDVANYIQSQESHGQPQSQQQTAAHQQDSPQTDLVPSVAAPIPQDAGSQRIALSPIQNAMVKSMTASLSIPHFLFTHSVDFTTLRKIIKRCREDPELASRLTDQSGTPVKLTLLPFILKALSNAAQQYPLINSSLDTTGSVSGKPEAILHGQHDFGVAMDTHGGLVVPVVRDVQNHSVLSLASEIARLAALAKAARLAPSEMSGATLVVSNIGSIGGGVVGPVIPAPTAAIVAVGAVEAVAAFETSEGNGPERIVKKEIAVLSWSADHRLLDGATVARCAKEVAFWLERPEMLSLGAK